MEFAQLTQQNEAARIIAMEESRDRGRSINFQAQVLQQENELDRLRALNAELVAVLREIDEFWAGGDAPEELTARMRSAIAKATQP